jgi:hypothetical protein
MAMAREEYSDFLDSVESGELDSGAARKLEVDLSSGERAYLALSSLAYGYYRLAEQAAAEPDQSPILIARLESWNALLSELYTSSGDDPALQRAVREAAEDLHRRAPRVGAECRDASGAPADCPSTGLLLRMLREADAQSGRHGVRGALTQLLNRLRGAEAPSR